MFVFVPLQRIFAAHPQKALHFLVPRGLHERAEQPQAIMNPRQKC
jgi:hypothetical protein